MVVSGWVEFDVKMSRSDFGSLYDVNHDRIDDR